MNQPNISLRSKAGFCFRSLVNFESYLSADKTDNSSRINKKIAGTSNDHASEFVSLLAHEVRNPLTNINLAIGFLKSSMKDDDQETYIDIIERNSVRINDLILQLLKTQHPDQTSEKHFINQLLESALVMAEDRIALKKITVIKAYTLQEEALTLNGVEMKIALSNIIINAIDAMTVGEGELKLITTSFDGRFILEIEDNGSGISKENLQNIFKPYYTSKSGGLGLGLCATLEILRSNQVEINVESREGEGTRFILLFGNKIHTAIPLLMKWSEAIQTPNPVLKRAWPSAVSLHASESRRKRALTGLQVKIGKKTALL